MMLKGAVRNGLDADGMLSRVLYRDGLMLVIDKPAGLPVHRGPKGGASIEDYFDVLRYGLPRAPALAHRLDKETSGCLVLGRHRKALAHVGLLFKHGKVGKTYWAVVEGSPEAGQGTIDLPLGRLNDVRGWWMKPDPHGVPAVTASPAGLTGLVGKPATIALATANNGTAASATIIVLRWVMVPSGSIVDSRVAMVTACLAADRQIAARGDSRP